MFSSSTHEEVTALLRSLRVPLILLDSQYNVTMISEQAASWDGRGVDEFIGRNWFDLYPNFQNAHFPGLLREAMETREAKTTTLHYVSRSGRELWFESVLQPFNSGLVISSRDITEQKRVERALEDQAMKYRLATLASDDIIYQWDADTGLVHWNEFGGRLFGQSSPTFTWWDEALHPDDRERIQVSLHSALESDANYWRDEYRIRLADGSYGFMTDRCFLLRDEAGRAVRGVGALLDFTVQRRTEMEVKRLESDLIRVARSSAMGTMASTLAHEINQPLTAMIQYLGGCERLIETQGGCEMMAEAIAMAKGGAERVADIIRRVRTMSVKGEVSKQPLCITTAVPEALNLALLGDVGRDVEVRLDIEQGISVMADPVQFQQVLTNLVSNAVQAMADTMKPTLCVCAFNTGQGDCVIRVEDNGPGVAPDQAEHLFDSFYSTKPGGMGIGLPISRTIIEAHDGSIEYKPGEGAGACFEIRLPLGYSDKRLKMA